MSSQQYLNSSQQRILSLLRCLAGNEIEGLAPGDVAKLNGCSPSQVTRDLANLHHAGLAEQLPSTGRWRLGPEIVQIAMRHMVVLDRAQTRLDEIKQRFSRMEDPSARQRLAEEPGLAARVINEFVSPSRTA